MPDIIATESHPLFLLLLFAVPVCAFSFAWSFHDGTWLLLMPLARLLVQPWWKRLSSLQTIYYKDGKRYTAAQWDAAFNRT